MSSGRYGPSSDYLSGLLSFLGKYSWAFNFRWVETVRDFQKGNEDQTEWHFGLRNHLNGWTEALESASFVQLKALVKGDDNASHHWPPDLVDFADQCRCYTRQLLLLTSVNPNLLRGKSKYGQLIQNIDAACVDFVPLKPRADRMVKKQPLKVNPKKAHEIDRMTSLVEWLLHARCKSSGEDPIPGTYNIYDARCGNFQTKPLFDELEIVDGAADSAGEEELVMPNFRYVVDIGSGLGHLPNSIARRLINATNGCCSQKDNVSQMEPVGNADSNNSFKPVCVIAVECNESMHIKACRSIDKTLQDNGVAELGLQHIERLLFRVEASDLDKLKSEITTAFLRRQRVTDEESVEPSAPPDYLVCGLHCCGDLGPSVIRLFNSHQQARSLLLVGCCYHKMALDTFPMSPLLREAMSQLVQLGTSLITESTLRLACQWSPCSWFTWCARDFNKHRLQFVGRTLLSHLQRHSKKSVITKERKSRRKNPSEIVGMKQLLDNPNLAFVQILPLLLAELCTELELDSEEMLSIIPATELEHLWTLTPGILAIQQLLQPLLEALILADRVWAVRSATGDGCYAGLVRLFEPHVSPRCIALVACRK